MATILRDDDYFDLDPSRTWDEPDIDWDSPPCEPGCPCPLCVEMDRQEAALLARLEAGESVGARRPWAGGEEEA
jgi:hypothetical protein